MLCFVYETFLIDMNNKMQEPNLNLTIEIILYIYGLLQKIWYVQGVS